MTDNKLPLWAKIVSVLLLLWGLMGVWSFYSELIISPEAAALQPAEQRALWDAMPKWLWFDFGVAVLAGLAGAIALLLRKAFAQHLYLLSLIAIFIQFGYIFAFMPILKTIGPSSAIFPGVIFLVGLAAWQLSRNWTARGWLTS
jgi:hypothetical protein